jgi:pimeloyl-ACP methyl ester carboxylesterase
MAADVADLGRTVRLVTADTVAFLETVVGQPADLVGHGDGALVAMLMAIRRPELVKRSVMISGGFDKAGEAAPDAEWSWPP